IGAALKLESPSTTDPRLHPTRQAMLSCCGKPIGVLGQIHPAIAETISLPESTVMAELDIDALCNAASDSATYRPISRNPAVRRDIAILIAKALPYEKVEKSIVAACGELLERHWLFDVYDGKGIPAGMHSLGLALQLRKFGGNLTDEEANQVREKAVAALAALGATPR
ncbi:MAG: phenylalanine--tRNA ligase subunit beta, partial [Fimbriimonas ginsengisoli]|nr:phenylalanine--tRNA ligase subunit beta [Fimbriimonas ginsengisoli]